ncbi:MAG: hypothetical protein LBG89_01675 [Rickettsiales bacterium]|nr:hypothetical protein [Rickettsiales bacterium]
MSKRLDICNLALLKLGERPIESMDGESAAAILARTLFPSVARALLSSYDWRFPHASEHKAEKWPDYFANAVSMKLAEEFCIPLCDNATMMRTLRDLAKDELKTAKLADIRGGSGIKNFSLIDQRF